MRQTPTDPYRVHRDKPTLPGQQFALDAFQSRTRSLAGFKYCDFLTDLATRRIYPIFSKDRSAPELCRVFTEFFNRHPEFRREGDALTRFVRCDPEPSYRSTEFVACLSTFGYSVEGTPPRDKHAGGIAERAVGLMTAKANIALLAPIPRAPQKFWDLAIQYACTTHAFNYASTIGDSPYHLSTGRHVDIKHLHPFWTPCYVYIPPEMRNGKLGEDRSYPAYMVGYAFTSVEFKQYYVVRNYGKGVYGKVRLSKDVVFDDYQHYLERTTNDYPLDPDFVLDETPDADPVAVPVPPEPAPAAPDPPVHVPPPRDLPAPPPVPVPPDPAPEYPAVLHPGQEPDAVYWYHLRGEYQVHQHPRYLTLNVLKVHDSRCPRNFKQACQDPVWFKAIETELTKFEVNHCLHVVKDTGQHKVPMMWLFNIKTDGTRKARLVVRGDQMIPYIDFDPNAVYCGNVSACSTKIVAKIAAVYRLERRDGDIVGAFLVTKSNPNFRWYIKTPQGYRIADDEVIEAVGNIYGAPPAGQNFSKEFDKCVAECGYKNTPWDLKLFYKWVDGRPILLIAHSDDFRWFGSPDHIYEWDLLIATFNAHKYQITDSAGKEFVGVHFYRDENFNYYMDQTRMIESIIKEANVSGCRDEHLPYPLTGPNLSKQDNATDEERAKCQKYPYRRVVGQLMYCMVHTLVTIMFALNVLSRYGNDPGPRHIQFLTHLLRYLKYAKKDRLIFKTYTGPRDHESYTAHLQLHFQCDADLGGNLDNNHSQTSYLGYLGGDLICWGSTDQGSVSTSTAESEMKAVAHALKAEVIACRGILNTMGWIQGPTRIEEDNAACVYASNATHMTRNLRHIDLTDSWIKEKVADGTCVLVKVDSVNNNSDLGTKRVSQSLFNALTHPLVDRQLRDNL